MIKIDFKDRKSKNNPIKLIYIDLTKTPPNKANIIIDEIKKQHESSNNNAFTYKICYLK